MTADEVVDQLVELFVDILSDVVSWDTVTVLMAFLERVRSGYVPSPVAIDLADTDFNLWFVCEDGRLVFTVTPDALGFRVYDSAIQTVFLN